MTGTLVQAIEEEIRRNEIDVAVLDPLVTLHSVPDLAAGMTDYAGDDMRGASAIKDAVRAARVLNQKTSKDAENFGVPEHERASYFRVDRVKGNKAPPSKAVWRHFVSVALMNEDEVCRGAVAPTRARRDYATTGRGRAHS